MIVVCEPVCRGFEHVEVNAAMLAVVAEAFPGERLLFCAEAGHANFVSNHPLVRTIKDVTFKFLEIQDANVRKDQQVVFENQRVNEILNLAQRHHSALVLFTGLNEMTVKAIKTQLEAFDGIKCFGVIHSILASVVKRPSIFFWKNRYSFRRLLLNSNSDRFKFIVLGESIEQQLVSRFPQLAPYVISIDHPYRFAAERDHYPFSNNKVVFGSLGVLRKVKGSHRFLSLARKVRARTTSYGSEFVCIGPIVDKKIRKMITSDVSIPSSSAPLSPEEYAHHANKIDYAVFLHSPETYSLTASGVFFDAFSYLKPVIAIKNPFFSSYFERMGNIGYLCEDYEELEKTIIRILNCPPDEEYHLQRKNLLLGRQSLQIQSIASRFSEKL